MHLTRQELTERWSTIKKIHFIGITSPFCSFSASALITQGITVTASEMNQDSDAAKSWIEKGVLYQGPHNADYITDDIDLVIFPNGAVQGNPEIEKTQNVNKSYVLVQELLGGISTKYKTIAIAGTHGKTTTTALVIWMLHKTIGTPNFIVGDAKDRIADLNSNWESHPESPYLILEACEYKKQFLDRAPSPYISVITHIDLDHTDFYHSQDEYNQAFLEFITPTQEAVIIDTEGKNEISVMTSYSGPAKVISISDIRQTFGHIKSPMFGNHNQENLLRAVAVGLALNIPKENILAALATFPGITSRFEYKGKTVAGALVYKDFAHNPQKITSCLQGAREAYPNKKLVAIYQPHNFERTSSFRKELVAALHEADIIIVPNIYSVREAEDDKKLITAEDFVQQIREAYPKKEIIFTNDLPPYAQTLSAVRSFDNEDAVILVISAGDVDAIIPDLLVATN